MADPSTAVGAKLFRSTDSGSNYTEVTGVYSVTRNGVQAERLDATVLTDTSRAYVDGLPDPQSFNVSIRYDGTDTQHQAVMTDDLGSVEQTWKIEIPDHDAATVTTVVATAYVQGLTIGLNVNAVQDATFTLQLTGAETVAYAQTAES